MSPEAGYLLVDQVVPRLISAIPNAVPCVTSEDTQELIQDGTAMAAKMVHNAEAQGKKLVRSANGQRQTITCGNVAYYCIVKLRSGRRSTGSSVVDVMATGTQLNGNTRMTSLDDVATQEEEAGGEIFEFHDVLAADQEDPGTKAARKLDWDTFLEGLSDRDRAIISCLVEGESLAQLARKISISASVLIERKRSLAQAIAEFMGLNILVEVQRRPNWQDSLNATRQRLACRVERAH